MIRAHMVSGGRLSPGRPAPGNGRADIIAGFTLIELLVVMIITSAVAGLVAPKMIATYEKVRAAAEEQKLVNLVETVGERAFLRQRPLTLTCENRRLEISGGRKTIQLVFHFLRFPDARITFNGNGFPDTDTLKYILRGVEKTLHVS